MTNPQPNSPKQQPQITPLRREQGVPYSQEAEEALLGAVIDNPVAFDRVGMNLQANDFFFIRHACIWQAMANLRERDEPIDVVMLNAELTTIGKLEESGGLAFFVQLARNTPSTTHADAFAGIVKIASARRRIIQQADTIRAKAMDETVPIEQMAPDVATLEHTLSDTNTDEMMDAAAAADLHHKMMVQIRSNPRSVATGIPEIDNFIGALRPGSVTVGFGNTEMGKSSFLQTVALNAAIAGKTVAFFNVADQGEFEIVTRMISMMSSMPRFNPGGKIIPAFGLGEGRLSKEQWPVYSALMTAFSKLPLFIDNTHGASPGSIKEMATRIQRRVGKLDLIVVDYFQDMHIRQTKYKDRRAELEDISSWMKVIGAEDQLNLPIIMGAQARQEVVDRENKIPTKRDVADCGAASKHATIMLALYREYQTTYEASCINEFTVAVVKNKQSGRAGLLHLRFNPQTTRIETKINPG